MSLINDALRRASEARPSAPTEEAAETPLRPADYPPRSPSWLYLALACLLLVLGGTGWFWLRGNKSTDLPAPTSNALGVAAREVPAAPVQASAPNPIPRTASAEPSLDQSASKPSVVTMAPASPAATASITATNAPIVEAKPVFPSVRLQGIFFQASRPSALINAKTVFIGDKVATAKVTAITRDSVTLQWNGETKVLTLE